MRKEIFYSLLLLTSFSASSQERHREPVVTTTLSESAKVEDVKPFDGGEPQLGREKENRKLVITEWEKYKETSRGELQVRNYIWFDGDKEVRRCEESAFLSSSFKKEHGYSSITSQALSSECEFLTLGEDGWEIDSEAYTSRTAYLLNN